MQDVKHLTNRRRGLLQRFLLGRGNRSPHRNRRFKEPEAKRDLRLRFILPLLALIMAGWPVYSLITGAGGGSAAARSKPVPAARVAAKMSPLDTFQSLQISADSLAAATLVGDRLQSPLADGSRITYNIDVELQEKVARYLAASRVPYGVFVAMEPKSGRVLGMVSHSSVNKEWEKSAYGQIYPMASLFKIVTASAALEQKKVSPETVVAFNGRLASVNPRQWEPRGRKSPEMTLTNAMGKSVNPVFGRVASHYVGGEQLVLQANRFGFNKPLFPGTSIRPSTAFPPQSESELKLMGAGLGREVKISPIHAAAMMAAVANNGVMMTPLLAEKVTGGGGENLYTATPMEMQRVLSEEAAQQLAKMLSTTVNSGTSRRAFHDRRGRPMLAKLNIAAKTGSIDGKEPEGQYSWFAAYAPMEDPQIALVALVVNQGKWNVKASNVGEKALEAFFR